MVYLKDILDRLYSDNYNNKIELDAFKTKLSNAQLIETGTEGNHRWYRWDNGLEIYWGNVTLNSKYVAWENIATTNAISLGNFKKPFIDKPKVFLTQGSGHGWWSNAISGTTATFGGNVFGTRGGSSVGITAMLSIDFLAIGRWK